MPADVEYKAVLDDSEVIKALRNIDRNMGKLAGQGDKSFTQVGKSAKLSGTQIGAMAGIVQELTRRFINMAEQAVRAFVEIARGGVELNKSLELLQIRVANVLGDNQEAAVAFLAIVQKTAKELRLDYVELAELATTILPDAESMEAAAEAAAMAMMRGRQLGVPEVNVRRAVTEALNGQYISMQKILNISSQQIEKIKMLEQEIGKSAAISQVLGEELAKSGYNVDDISKSFIGIFGLIQSEAQQLQIAFSKPIFDELIEQGQAFLKVLDENRDDIGRVAVAFGELAASIVELIGTNLIDFLDSIDYKQLEATADALNDMVAALELLINVIGGMPDDTDLGPLVLVIESIKDALVTAAQAAALLKATLDALPGVSLATILLGPVGIPLALSDAKKAAESGLTAQERYRQSLLESVEAFNLFGEQIKKNEEQTKERSKATENATDKDKEAGDEWLRQQQILKALAAAEAAAAEAREKLSGRLADVALDRERKLVEIYQEQGRKLLEDEIENAQKREDLARKNADKIEDIWRDHQQEIADAARDLSRAEEDIYRKYARDRAETERDSARERIDIETEYRRELERIRARFEESAAEAERNNDAQAYLEAVRQRDRDVEEAKRSRTESIEDAGMRAAEQRENLRLQLAYEIEDAKIANVRKLEDLQIRLDRELEAQRLNYQRDLEEQAITEARKAEERARAYDQELEDFTRKEFQKLQDLQKSLSTELETIKKYEDLKRQERVRQAQRTVAEVNSILSRLLSGLSGGTTTTRSVPALTGRQRLMGLQEGGPVEPGRPYIVGERGPELFIPANAGRILPQVVSLPAPAAAGAVSNVSTTVSPNFNVSESLFSDPVAVRKLQNLVLGVLTEAL